MEVFQQYQKEIEVITEAIYQFIPIALAAQKEILQIEEKCNKTPVTAYDFAGQAMLCHAIFSNFPSDSIVGEEDFSHVNPEILHKVKQTLQNKIDPVEVISRCTKSIPSTRCWAIDPIDGTYSFLEGKHFAIGTSLLINRKAVISAIGWPTHSSQLTGVNISGPLIFVSAEKIGNFVVTPKMEVISIPKPTSIEPILLCNENSSRNEKGLPLFIKKQLGIPSVIGIGSMVKGIILACGKGIVYVRVKRNDKEPVWDISPFELFVREAGAFITNIHGELISYPDDGSFYVVGSESPIVCTFRDESFHNQVISLVKQYESA